MCYCLNQDLQDFIDLQDWVLNHHDELNMPNFSSDLRSPNSYPGNPGSDIRSISSNTNANANHKPPMHQKHNPRNP